MSNDYKNVEEVKKNRRRRTMTTTIRATLEKKRTKAILNKNYII